MSADRYTRERITDALLTARDGLVSYGDACEWLTNYPERLAPPGSRHGSGADAHARFLHGAQMLGRALDALHGAPPGWESRAPSADYLPDADGGRVSLAALIEAARISENIPLLALIQSAQDERAAVLAGLPQGTPTVAAVQVATETPAQRCARLLKWRDEEVEARGMRGAVARVTAREKLQRPTADRSNVGKDIKKAEEEQRQARRAGSWAAQLG
jgi:hypothetical protein